MFQGKAGCYSLQNKRFFVILLFTVIYFKNTLWATTNRLKIWMLREILIFSLFLNLFNYCGCLSNTSKRQIQLDPYFLFQPGFMDGQHFSDFWKSVNFKGKYRDYFLIGRRWNNGGFNFEKCQKEENILEKNKFYIFPIFQFNN